MKHLLILSVVVLSGCSIINEVKQQVETIDQRASISGKVVNQSGQKGPILATLLKSDGNFVRWVDDYQVSANGAYKFFTLAGSYTVGAFVDLNNDGEYQANEPATYLGENASLPSMFTLRANKNKKLQILTIKQTLAPEGSSRIVFDSRKAQQNIGRVVSLRDRMFSSDNAVLGMFRPLDFAEQVGGGLFLLRKYQPGRIPVIFVHGINGSPTDWKAPIKALDLNKFQPFVFYYASGLPLDMVSEFLLQAVNKLQSRHGFAEFYLAAHSMGGLVTRSFVKKYVARENPAKIGLVVTVNSPMKGLKSAQTGVKYFPIVVPAWRDVAYKSKFVRALRSWPWPQDIPYHLVFAYLSDEAGDGVVELESQIPRSQQKEATRIYGFEGGHAELLRDRKFVAEFNTILSSGLK